MYLDADNIFSETLLFTMKESIKTFTQNNSYNIKHKGKSLHRGYHIDSNQK